MNIDTIGEIAVIHCEDVIISDTQSALDLMATVRYETGCDRVAIPKHAVEEKFFALSSGIAGEILQKFVTYRMKLAIIGNFSAYNSRALRDFIYESNKGNHIYFVTTKDEALAKLSSAP